MSSILYIVESQEAKSKLKDALNVFLRSMDAMKFNAEHTISIEGWDVLTFLVCGVELASDILVPNAPYEHVKLINTNLSSDVVQHMMTDRNYTDYTIYDLGIDVDNLTNELLISLLEGTTHNYDDVYSGKTQLIDDIQFSPQDIERLVKLAEEK